MPDWTSTLGLIVSAAAAFGPWLFAVHAKLAVIASRMDEIGQRLERLAAAHDERLAMCIAHQSRLERHETLLGHDGGEH